jgi:NAD/NADP transhydrogenase beta subunit
MRIGMITTNAQFINTTKLFISFRKEFSELLNNAFGKNLFNVIAITFLKHSVTKRERKRNRKREKERKRYRDKC